MKFWEPLKANSWSRIYFLIRKTYPAHLYKKKTQINVFFKSKKCSLLIKNCKKYGYETGKYSSIFGVCGCFIWLFYQVQNTLTRIKQIVRTETLDLDFKRSDYIYLPGSQHIKDVLGIQIIDRNGNLIPSESRSVYSTLWEDYKKSRPWRLLRLAQCKSWSGRQQAVRELATLHHLEASDYQQLAQSIDVRTAVALARTPNVEERLFLSPRFSNKSVQLKESLKTLLEILNENIRHSCLDYILSTYFADYNDEKGTDLYAYWLETLQIPYHLLWVYPDDIVHMSLRSLVHHCSLDDYPHLPVDFVKHGGLAVLMQVYREFPDNEEVVVQILEMLYLCSIHSSVVSALFAEGWIRILAKLLKKSDLRLRSWAAKILVNLDKEDGLSCAYPLCFDKEAFLLHPVHRNSPSRVDVVLIHGLLGNVFVTWRQRDEAASAPLGIFSVQPQGSYEKFYRPFSRPVIPGLMDDLGQEIMEQLWSEENRSFAFVFTDCPTAASVDSSGPFSCDSSDSSIVKLENKEQMYTQCWPRDWLSSDVNGLRVLGINYETSLSHWMPYCPQTDSSKRKLEDRSELILDQLLRCGLGERPIVFIAHSMGGLLVKNMLATAWQRYSSDVKYSKFLNQTKAVMFFSTPHKGAHLASMHEGYRFLLLPTMELDELRLNTPKLLQLHDTFLKIVRSTNMKVVSFAETQGTMFSSLKINIPLVPRPLADPNIGEYYEIPLDHINICKPDSTQSFLYQKVLHCLRDILHNAGN